MRALAITGIVTASWISRILVGIGHAGDAAVAADVGRHALQRHHGARARLLGDARLLGVGHVHDHAALEHLRQAALDTHGSGFSHCNLLRPKFWTEV